MFALEAEGFAIVAREALPATVREILPIVMSCTIVDEEAIDLKDRGWERVELLPQPVILLLDRIMSVPEKFSSWVLKKPLLGRTLVDSVAAAISDDTRFTT